MLAVAALLGLIQAAASVAGHDAASAQPVPGEGAANPVPGYAGVAELRAFYNVSDSLTTSRGSRQRVVIIDAYDTHLESALAIYRRTYKLPVCSRANGCLVTLDPRGRPSMGLEGISDPTAHGAGMAEIVSAICPNCDITVVFGPSGTMWLRKALLALNTARVLHAKYVTTSAKWFAKPASLTILDRLYIPKSGVVQTAASGNSGFLSSVDGGAPLPIWPQASPSMISVGGAEDDAGKLASWTATDGTKTLAPTSACIPAFPRPSWQQGIVEDSSCKYRAIADISGLAGIVSLNFPSATDSANWVGANGTSVAAPAIAALAALDDQPGPTDVAPSYLYQRTGTSAIRDVVAGKPNGDCNTPLCDPTLRPGWDGPTGLGVPNGTSAFDPPHGTPAPAYLLKVGSDYKVNPTGSSNCLGVAKTEYRNAAVSIRAVPCANTDYIVKWHKIELNVSSDNRARSIGWKYVLETPAADDARCLQSGQGSTVTLGDCFGQNADWAVHGYVLFNFTAQGLLSADLNSPASLETSKASGFALVPTS